MSEEAFEMKSRISILRCPRTFSQLKLEGERLLNADNELAGGMHGEIIQFDSRSIVESESERRSLSSLLLDARKIGFHNALLKSRDRGFVAYVTDRRRAKFLDYLPIDRTKDVLEIGPGLGQFTVEIARRARTLYALEVVTEQAAIVAERAIQEGATNVQVVAGGADCQLPFNNGTFDVVVLNLVLEWCGSRASEPHEVMQRRLIREMLRVLRPGGVAWISTKNRYGIGYILGKPDEHFSGMRFGSALPRWLANLLHSRRSSGHLHSYRALRGMLLDNGFSKVDSYWAVPEMRFPQTFIRTDAAAVRKARSDPDLVQGESRSVSLIMKLIPAYLVRHFTTGLAVLAHKEARDARDKGV